MGAAPASRPLEWAVPGLFKILGDLFRLVHNICLCIALFVSHYFTLLLSLFCMRIKNQYKLRKVAGEDILLIQGQVGGAMSKVIAFNETSVLLWDALKEQDFELPDVAKCLSDNFEVDAATAARDAEDWIQMLSSHGVIEQ